jgi:hypothetical protein
VQLCSLGTLRSSEEVERAFRNRLPETIARVLPATDFVQLCQHGTKSSICSGFMLNHNDGQME